MTEETKRSGAGVAFAKPSYDERKPAAPAKKLAFENHSVEKDIAEYIKKEFDKKHGPTWHCIVGRNFEIINTVVEILKEIPSSDQQ
ncbi:hypothetical protein HHK36_020806 [Tetracentron sinense]|uniref:Dynein light chain n=1 Tax=Tetracentron sinense TaxID=13715 RepID=A0A835DBD8_TETSI|nr:hypothetical protein HHK36_020806 [Tetracentron sinense]